ncbi:hypothetical protein [Methanoregula sp.]|uniref:hypothetical protein n=1 Tax=Methanoregula sp. TaxID=2052170 RepID=UPI003BB18012
MKVSLVGIMTMVLVVTATVFAGCTNSAPSSSIPISQVTASVTTIVRTPTLPTTRQPSATITAETTTPAAVTVFGAYNWAEYRNNMTTTPPAGGRYQWEADVKIERTTGTYDGTPAVHYKITNTEDYSEWIGNTLTTTKNGAITVFDTYYDASTNTFLGGTETDTIKGVVNPATDIPVTDMLGEENHPSGALGISPFGEMNTSLTYNGTGSVTVPAGTYMDAQRYTGNFHDGTPIMFWVVSGIPVPVQYQFPNKYLVGEDPFQSYELKGWG